MSVSDNDSSDTVFGEEMWREWTGRWEPVGPLFPHLSVKMMLAIVTNPQGRGGLIFVLVMHSA
jgi:hypothetical protein